MQVKKEDNWLIFWMATTLWARSDRLLRLKNNWIHPKGKWTTWRHYWRSHAFFGLKASSTRSATLIPSFFAVAQTKTCVSLQAASAVILSSKNPKICITASSVPMPTAFSASKRLASFTKTSRSWHCSNSNSRSSSKLATSTSWSEKWRENWKKNQNGHAAKSVFFATANLFWIESLALHWNRSMLRTWL